MTAATERTVWTPQLAADAWRLFEALVLDTGQRWGDPGNMQPWQRDAFGAILGLPGAPSLERQQIWIEGPTGSGKDQLLAAVVLAIVRLAPEGFKALCYSSDLDRCKDIVSTVRGFITRTDSRALDLGIGRWLGLDVETLEHEIRRVGKTEGTRKKATLVSVMVESLDGNSASGSRADLYLMNEVQSWPDPHGEMVWDESLARFDKITHGRFVVCSNAPFTSPGDFRRDERDKALSPGAENPWWSMSVKLEDCPWWTPEKLERKRLSVRPHVWRRLYLCLPTDGRGELIAPEDFEACVDDKWSEQQEPVAGRIYFHGLDVGVTRDHAVHLVLHRDLVDRRIYLDRMRVWLPKTNAQIDLDAVEQHVAAEFATWPGYLYADPYQAVQMCQRLARRHGADKVAQVGFTVENLTKMCEAVRSAFLDRRMVVWKDAGQIYVTARTTTSLRRQVLEAEVVSMEKGERIKSKRSAKGGHGDQLSALALALYGVTARGMIGQAQCAARPPEDRRRADSPGFGKSGRVWMLPHGGKYLGARVEMKRKVTREAS